MLRRAVCPLRTKDHLEPDPRAMGECPLRLAGVATSRNQFPSSDTADYPDTSTDCNGYSHGNQNIQSFVHSFSFEASRLLRISLVSPFPPDTSSIGKRRGNLRL